MTAATSAAPPRQRPAGWRFWLPLVAQVALILAVPAQVAYTYFTGQTIVLQVAPVDPYDFLRGYYVTLTYDISNPATLRELPGAETLDFPEEGEFPVYNDSLFNNGKPFYLILQAPEQTNATPPEAWEPVAVQGDRPTDLPANQIALEGTYLNGRLLYGLESYYIPEDQRDAINSRIWELQSQTPPVIPDSEITPVPEPELPPIVIEVRVNPQGDSYPLTMWLEEQPYRF